MGCFNKWWVICPTFAQQPLYKWFGGRNPDRCVMSAPLADLPDLDDEETQGELFKTKNLVVFDDAIASSSKELNIIKNFFLKARHYNIMPVIIAQAWKGIPRTIRLQCNYVAMKKISDEDEIKDILADKKLGDSFGNVKAMYDWVMSSGEPTDFFMVDTVKGLYRKNLDQIIEAD
jgi:hypothetical protein